MHSHACSNDLARCLCAVRCSRHGFCGGTAPHVCLLVRCVQVGWRLPHPRVLPMLPRRGMDVARQCERHVQRLRQTQIQANHRGTQWSGCRSRRRGDGHEGRLKRLSFPRASAQRRSICITQYGSDASDPAKRANTEPESGRGGVPERSSGLRDILLISASGVRAGEHMYSAGAAGLSADAADALRAEARVCWALSQAGLRSQVVVSYMINRARGGRRCL